MVLNLNYFMVLVSSLSNDGCGNAVTVLCSEGGNQMRVQEGPCGLVPGKVQHGKTAPASLSKDKTETWREDTIRLS